MEFEQCHFVHGLWWLERCAVDERHHVDRRTEHDDAVHADLFRFRGQYREIGEQDPALLPRIDLLKAEDTAIEESGSASVPT